ncbi:MAG: MFS transporter [Thermoplasmata archaeon]|nr:MFS transporter [Thermoplasmata archaeon]
MSYRDLIPLSCYSLLASNRGSLFIVYLPTYLIIVKGATPPEALATVSVAYVAASLLAPVAGRWSDRVGRRKPFLLGAELSALPVFLLIPFLATAELAGAAFVAANVLLAFGAPAVSAYVADASRAAERGAGYGLLNAAGNAGGIAGFVAIALLSIRYGWSALFPFIVVVMVGTVLVVAFFVPEVSVAPTPHRRPWREYRALTTFSLAVSIRGLGMGAVGTFYGYYATQLGASTWQVGVIAIVGLVTGALISIPFGRLVDRRGEISGVLWGTVLSLIGIGVFFVATTWGELIPAQVLRVLGISLLSPAMLSYAARLSPEGHRAEFLGVFSLVNSTFWSLGPLIGGVVLGFYGASGLFVFAGVTAVISLIAVEGLYYRAPRPPPTPAAGVPMPGRPSAPGP